MHDKTLVNRDARTSSIIDPDTRCGGGLPQPGWDECGLIGEWEVLRPDGEPYHHAYCTGHAAMRLRGADRLLLESIYERRSYRGPRKHVQGAGAARRVDAV